MTPIEFFIYAIFAALMVNLGMWLDDRAERRRLNDKARSKKKDKEQMEVVN